MTCVSHQYQIFIAVMCDRNIVQRPTNVLNNVDEMVCGVMLLLQRESNRAFFVESKRHR